MVSACPVGSSRGEGSHLCGVERFYTISSMPALSRSEQCSLLMPASKAVFMMSLTGSPLTVPPT